MIIDNDELSRSLAQLAGDPATEAEAVYKSVEFSAALRRLGGDPREAARVDALADAIADEGMSPHGSATPLPTSEPEARGADLAATGFPPAGPRPPARSVWTGRAAQDGTRLPAGLLARSAGAQPGVLRRARTDQVRFTAMGGVLLATAGIAGLSAIFALKTAADLPLPAAVIAGALWAMLIFSVDRMLVVSMTRQSGWVRNLLAAVPRLLLAMVLGAVVSVPLVLQVFRPEINSELQVMHAENITNASAAIGRQFADIVENEQKVAQLQAIASGENQSSVSSDPDVVNAQKRVDDEQHAYNEAVARAQCELDGTCGTRLPGKSTLYYELRQYADNAKASLDDAKARLDAANSAAQLRIAGSIASNRQAAQTELSTLVPQLDKRRADRVAAQNRVTANESSNDGLLARLEALNRISAGHSSLASAQWSLYILFLLIEMLPVLTKLLTMIGAPTLYDRMLIAEEDNLQARAQRQDDVATQIEQHLLTEQIRTGKEANTLIAEVQAKIARKAMIDAWAQIAASSSDEEIVSLYNKYLGQRSPALPRF